jgi:plasmid stabilization system protein ParE
METKIVRTEQAEQNLQNTSLYFKDNCQPQALNKYDSDLKSKLIILHPNPAFGFKSAVLSKFRKTLIAEQYALIYTHCKYIITIFRIKHNSQNK